MGGMGKTEGDAEERNQLLRVVAGVCREVLQWKEVD